MDRMNMKEIESPPLPEELWEPMESLKKIAVFGGGAGAAVGYAGVAASAVGSLFADWLLQPGVCASLGWPLGAIAGAYTGAVAGGMASRLLDWMGWEAEPTYVERADGANVFAALLAGLFARRQPGRHERWRKAGRFWGGVLGGAGAAALGFVAGL